MRGFVNLTPEQFSDPNVQRRVNELLLERKRMEWLMRSVIAPGHQFQSLWDTYWDITDEQWKEQGL